MGYTTKKKYITAYDREIRVRVPHIVKNGRAISLVTKKSFPYKPKR